MEKGTKSIILRAVLAFAIVFGIALVGSIFTAGSVNSEWYENIKPAITPPNYVFPIVWNILFFLIALSLFFVLGEKNKKKRNPAIWIFAINLILNALWSYLFFSMHKPVLAFVDLVLIWISIVAMIFISHKISKKAAYLLLPYLLWVAFAGILNWLIAF